jgi:hypothetical protein
VIERITDAAGKVVFEAPLRTAVEENRRVLPAAQRLPHRTA